MFIDFFLNWFCLFIYFAFIGTGNYLAISTSTYIKCIAKCGLDTTLASHICLLVLNFDLVVMMNTISGRNKWKLYHLHIIVYHCSTLAIHQRIIACWICKWVHAGPWLVERCEHISPAYRRSACFNVLKIYSDFPGISLHLEHHRDVRPSAAREIGRNLPTIAEKSKDREDKAEDARCRPTWATARLR